MTAWLIFKSFIVLSIQYKTKGEDERFPLQKKKKWSWDSGPGLSNDREITLTHWPPGCGSMSALVAQLCPALCDPIDCSSPGSCVHGILRDRMPEWFAVFFSRGSFWPRDQTLVSHIAGMFFTVWVSRENPQDEKTLLKQGQAGEVWDFKDGGVYN